MGHTLILCDSNEHRNDNGLHFKLVHQSIPLEFLLKITLNLCKYYLEEVKFFS